MSARRKFETLLRMSAADRWLLIEAMLWLGLARFFILAIPFKTLARFLAWLPQEGEHPPPLLLRVRHAVKAAARNVPWNAVCLPQAIAAKVMLARRGCGSTLHLGAGFDQQGKLVAHAWVVVGATVVVGAAGMQRFTSLTRFG